MLSVQSVDTRRGGNVNIYQKLQKCRVELQAMNLKKSGNNKFAGYTYFELGDFLPHVNKLMLDHNLASNISFSTELATLTIIDADKPSDTLTFTSPMSDANLKGCHAIQNLGAVQTYLRRYLWTNAMEISEHDALDAVTGKAQSKKTEEKSDIRKEIGKMLMEMANNDTEKASLMLEAYTTFEGKNGTVKGRKSVKDLTDKQLQPTYGKIKAEYLAFTGGAK